LRGPGSKCEQNTRFGLDIRRTASEYRFGLRLVRCLLLLESYALVDVWVQSEECGRHANIGKGLAHRCLDEPTATLIFGLD